MKPILCHECKHNIDDHNTTGCVNKLDDRFTCACENLPSDIAAHAVQAVVSEAVNVIQELTLWVYEKEADGFMYCRWCGRDEKTEHREDCQYRASRAYLAAHQYTTPQDVRTVAERNLDQWQEEVIQTRESDRPL